MWVFFSTFFGRHDWLLYQRFFLCFVIVVVVVQVTAVCVLSVFIAPLLTVVGLLPTTIARRGGVARRARRQ